MFRLQPEDVELITRESGGWATPDETAPALGTTGPAPELVSEHIDSDEHEPDGL
jgi:hypothetical protein